MFQKDCIVPYQATIRHELCYVKVYRAQTQPCLLEKQFNADICKKTHVFINKCLLYKVRVTGLTEIDIPLASQNSSLFRKPH